jgi:hypothetical protein
MTARGSHGRYAASDNRGSTTTANVTPRRAGRYLADLAERTAATYAEVFLGLLIASGLGVDQVTDLAVWEKAAVAAVPAALAVVKGALASRIGAPDSASVLPADEDPPQQTP